MAADLDWSIAEFVTALFLAEASLACIPEADHEVSEFVEHKHSTRHVPRLDTLTLTVVYSRKV